MEAHSKDYTSDKHRKQWPATLETYACPIIGQMHVSDITISPVLEMLEQQTSAQRSQLRCCYDVLTRQGDEEIILH